MMLTLENFDGVSIAIIIMVETRAICQMPTCFHNSSFTASSSYCFGFEIGVACGRASVLEPPCFQTEASNITLFVSEVNPATNSFSVSISTGVPIAGFQFKAIASGLSKP